MASLVHIWILSTLAGFRRLSHENFVGNPVLPGTPTSLSVAAWNHFSITNTRCRGCSSHVWKDTSWIVSALASIAPLLDAAGRSLNNDDGHIYYLAQNPNFGIVGMIDSSGGFVRFWLKHPSIHHSLTRCSPFFWNFSECPPTFGARPEDVRCLMVGGWSQLKNRDGDLSSTNKNDLTSVFDIELNETKFSPRPSDTVIFLHLCEPSQSERGEETAAKMNVVLAALSKAKQSGATTAIISIGSKLLLDEDNSIQVWEIILLIYFIVQVVTDHCCHLTSGGDIFVWFASARAALSYGSFLHPMLRRISSEMDT